MNLNKDLILKYQRQADRLVAKLGLVPDVAFVAGSGIADALLGFEIIKKIDYIEFPIFPKVGVVGHRNELILLRINNKNILVFLGRFHLYEGNTLETVCSQVLISHFIGIDKIYLTNAAGGLNPILKPGDLLIVNDFINFSSFNLNGILVPNENDFYRTNHPIIDSEQSSKLSENMINNGLSHKNGTYLMVTGPYYETRGEIRLMRLFGADVVGMSTYFEAQLASILGMKASVISLVTNSAKEIKQTVSHQEVTDVAKENNFKIQKLMLSIAKI